MERNSGEGERYKEAIKLSMKTDIFLKEYEGGEVNPPTHTFVREDKRGIDNSLKKRPRLKY